MSGIAGIIRFDGAPVEPGQVEKMTAAMVHRGPDGIHHWVRGSVALGQCMLRTTPESLEETQPLTNEDASLVLVMDGRVDNFAELRRELLGRGAVLRNRSDAELALRAYEAWGEACPDRIVGEYAFFIWDSRQNRLFAARDAAGTRHFYYHAGRGWFAFASEIKGLLALQDIEPRLNESRVLDYLVPEFDRDDEVGTFYQGIDRMPAGHAMTVREGSMKTWRYWNPGDLGENRFASLNECAEAFLEQMRIAVKCRLRSIGPVGAMLSGGLDSSSIVGLIRKEFRDELGEPLRTFSLVRDDRENCADWAHIQPILREGWVDPNIVTTAIAAKIWRPLIDSINATDEPFALSHGLIYHVMYDAARQKGCNVMLDGMAGDLLFFGPDQSLKLVFETRRFDQLSAVLAAHSKHKLGKLPQKLARAGMASIAPPALKDAYGRWREETRLRTGHLGSLHADVAQRLLQAKRVQRLGGRGDHRAMHARSFTTGVLSFAHEVYGQLAFAQGVEPRSPFSDRRLIEFAVRMPLEAKLAAPWYKLTQRNAMEGYLPEAVRWRTSIGQNPGWKLYEELIDHVSRDENPIWNRQYLDKNLNRWVASPWLSKALGAAGRPGDYNKKYNTFVLLILARWLASIPKDSIDLTAVK